MKKFISLFFILITVVLVAIVCTFSASAEQIGQIGDCIWTLDGTELTVSGVGKLDFYETSYFEKSNITSIVIEEGITDICSGSFQNYVSLTHVSLPNSLSYIGAGAFLGCTYLTDIVIPRNVKLIDDEVFLRCDSLVNIFVDDGNAWYSDVNGVLFSKDASALIQYPMAKPESVYVVPSTVKEIKSHSFDGARYLTDVELHDDIVKIGVEAFSNTKMINDSKNIFNGVVYLGNYLIRIQYKELSSYPIRVGTKIIADGAFCGASELEKVALCEGLTHIGEGAFASCSRLHSIYLPQSLVSIGSGAFDNCSALINGYYGGIVDELNPLLSSHYYLKRFSWIGRADGSRVIKHVTGYHKVIKEATCCEYGIILDTCSECLLEKTIRVFPDSSKHIPVEWKETRVATCSEKGEAESLCLACGDILKLSLPALGHKFGEWTFISKASCGIGEVKTHTCSVCSYSEKVASNAKGHIWGEEKILKHPTDKEVGMAVSFCTVCGVVQSTELPTVALEEKDNLIGTVVGIAVTSLVVIGSVIIAVILIRKKS